jgi:amino acid transporter
MSDDWIVWGIIAAFYLPLHTLPPLAVTFIWNRAEAAERNRRLIRVLIDALLTMAIAFALILWLARDHLQLAMFIMLASLLPPWWRALRYRRS